MEKVPLEALDAIRQHLQVILLRADLCGSPNRCEECTRTICEIVKEVRALEAYLRDIQAKGQ
jgi:hypothetical protein